MTCRRCSHEEHKHAEGPKNPNKACTEHGCKCKGWQPDMREAEAEERVMDRLRREGRLKETSK